MEQREKSNSAVLRYDDDILTSDIRPVSDLCLLGEWEWESHRDRWIDRHLLNR